MTEKEDDPESSPAHEVELDPEEEARRIILARRARFVAVALVSAGVGTAACGGQTGDRSGSTPQPCLSLAATGGTGNTPQVCLTVWYTGGSGGVPQPCLEPPLSTGGAPQPCLSDSGMPQPCLRMALDAGSSDARADAPVTVPGDAMPLPCLTPMIPNLPDDGNGS